MIHSKTRALMRMVLAIAYFIVGIVHLRAPQSFLPIMPDFVPYPTAVIIATGFCEMAGAVGLLIGRTRKLAGIMLALYAVCVFPANIKHAVEGVQLAAFHATWWYHAPRLALQPVLIWWALFCGEVIDWPHGRSRASERHI